jgi:A/G-specific adenine glycosylase
MADSSVAPSILTWFGANARPLPWRRDGVTPWEVLVSEVMLQQTPVSRVVPVYQGWLDRWPDAAALAAAEPGDAVRMWGRLGYPRRALRLHEAASVCVRSHGGTVPRAVEDLRALPGVGDYTAAAVAAFAFGQRAVVLDSNVRRVHARLLGGQERAPAGSPALPERRRADQLLPQEDGQAALLSVAVMELGALVCTSRAPACGGCPVAGSCAWLRAGRPAWTGPAPKRQTYAGTDRQCRGRLLDVVRRTDGPLPRSAFVDAWQDADQRDRALRSLVSDGLVEMVADESPGHDRDQLFTLPSGRGPALRSGTEADAAAPY